MIWFIIVEAIYDRVGTQVEERRGEKRREKGDRENIYSVIYKYMDASLVFTLPVAVDSSL